MTNKVINKIPRDARTLVILLAGSSISIPATLLLTGDVEITYIIGLVLGAVSALAYLKYRKVYKIVLGVALLVGTADLAKYIFIEFTIGGSITIGYELAATFQVFSFFLLLDHLYTNRGPFVQFLNSITSERELTEEELFRQKEVRIEAFMAKYMNKSVDELTRISNSADAFDQNAIEAAVRLLREKNAR